MSGRRSRTSESGEHDGHVTAIIDEMERQRRKWKLQAAERTLRPDGDSLGYQEFDKLYDQYEAVPRYADRYRGYLSRLAEEQQAVAYAAGSAHLGYPMQYPAQQQAVYAHQQWSSSSSPSPAVLAACYQHSQPPPDAVYAAPSRSKRPRTAPLDDQQRSFTSGSRVRSVFTGGDRHEWASDWSSLRRTDSASTGRAVVLWRLDNLIPALWHGRSSPAPAAMRDFGRLIDHFMRDAFDMHALGDYSGSRVRSSAHDSRLQSALHRARRFYADGSVKPYAVQSVEAAFRAQLRSDWFLAVERLLWTVSRTAGAANAVVSDRSVVSALALLKLFGFAKMIDADNVYSCARVGVAATVQQVAEQHGVDGSVTVACCRGTPESHEAVKRHLVVRYIDTVDDLAEFIRSWQQLHGAPEAS